MTDDGYKEAIEATLDNINEIVLNIDTTFDYYKTKPKWATLQTLFRLAFQLGYEYGRKGVFESKEIIEKEKRERDERKNRMANRKPRKRKVKGNEEHRQAQG